MCPCPLIFYFQFLVNLRTQYIHVCGGWVGILVHYECTQFSGCPFFGGSSVWTIRQGVNSVSIVGRLPAVQSVHYQRFHCILHTSSCVLQLCYIILFLNLPPPPPPQDREDPFYLVDLGRLLELHTLWKTALPGVHPFYAVKCNNDPALLQTLAALGCGFDCASKVTNTSLHQLCKHFHSIFLSRFSLS